MVASAGGDSLFAVLVLIVVFAGDRDSHSSKTQKQKRKKLRKRSQSRSPPVVTGQWQKRRALTAFKGCKQCKRKISITDAHTDAHDICLACLGKAHPMLNCRQCLAFKWKAFRGRFFASSFGTQ